MNNSHSRPFSFLSQQGKSKAAKAFLAKHPVNTFIVDILGFVEVLNRKLDQPIIYTVGINIVLEEKLLLVPLEELPLMLVYEGFEVVLTQSRV